MRSEQKRTSFSWCDNIAGNEQPKKKRARFRFHFILKYSLINQTEDEYKMRNNYTREHRMQERAYRWKFIVAMRIAWPTTQSITRKKKIKLFPIYCSKSFNKNVLHIECWSEVKSENEILLLRRPIGVAHKMWILWIYHASSDFHQHQRSLNEGK